MLAFVINKHGEALMPARPKKVRLLLKEKKAKVVSYKPFTIQLLYGSSGYRQESLLGSDTGAKNIGIGIASQENVLIKGEVEMRQDIKTNLATRHTYRRSRRYRKTRYRRPKFKFKTKRYYDSKKKKWLKKKICLSSPKKEGWLPPSIQSRLDKTFFWIDKFRSLLPDPELTIEVGKFDVQNMMDPGIEGVGYQQGPAYGYYDVRYYVFARDNYTCKACKKKGKILQTHHIVYRAKGGSDRADNLITVCTDCHTHENHQKGQIFWKWLTEGKKLLQYKETVIMNIIRKRAYKRYPEANFIYGSETTERRKLLGLEKTHYNDAIAASGIPGIKKNPEDVFLIRQFRKKKRSLHEATARKGRNAPNRDSRRNTKNTKELKGFYLNDKVKVFSKVGFITGFTGSGMAYVKDEAGQYITNPGKSYKQVSLSECELVCHNNNWQFIS